MAGKEEYRIFVGGLPWYISDRDLESKFSRFGIVCDSQVMVEKETGRSRGFGFITFSDRRGMETAIKEMHGREYGNRVISVNKAKPRVGEDVDHGHRGVKGDSPDEEVEHGRGGGYSSGEDVDYVHWGEGHSYGDRNRGNYGRGRDRGDKFAVGKDNCFNCGWPAGHEDCLVGAPEMRPQGPEATKKKEEMKMVVDDEENVALIEVKNSRLALMVEMEKLKQRDKLLDILQKLDDVDQFRMTKDELDRHLNKIKRYENLIAHTFAQ